MFLEVRPDFWPILNVSRTKIAYYFFGAHHLFEKWQSMVLCCWYKLNQGLIITFAIVAALSMFLAAVLHSVYFVGGVTPFYTNMFAFKWIIAIASCLSSCCLCGSSRQ